jgi:hypothetical protein
MVARAWRSYAAFDPIIHQTLINAQQANFSQAEVGVYMFSCYS